ncbi:MAG: hypothetical protein ACRDSL_21125 [Pseudonocardiaceae bacterium]
MSGESASIVDVCAVAAAGTLVAARAVTGVARTVLTAPGAGVSAVGRRMEQGYARHQERQAALAEWEAAAREVVDRNARLSVLAARPGGPPGLPAPLVLRGQNLEQLTAWCAATDEALDGVERALLAEAASAVSVVLASVAGPESVNPESVDTVPEASAAALEQHRQAGTAPPAELVEACRRILGGLAADVAAADHTEVLAAVARVRECRTPAERQGWLAELRVRVREANAGAARRREQARTAATMMQALAESAQPAATQPRTARLWSELADVVAGRRALDPELHSDALAACEQVRAERENGYVRDSLTHALERLGYQVDQGFDTFTGQGARLRLVRDQWPEHAVSVLVDSGEVRAMVVRTESAEGDDAARLDAEREQQWCADFEELRDQLVSDGLRLDVQRLVPPGERPVPIAAQRRPAKGQRLAKDRERTRERGR